MSEETERFVRWYAHLPPDAPLDRHAARVLLHRALADREALAEYLLEQQCTPALLREFIFRHWNDAINAAPFSVSIRLASAVMRALGDERDRRDTLDNLQRGIIPTVRTLRRLCEEINDE